MRERRQQLVDHARDVRAPAVAALLRVAACAEVAREQAPVGELLGGEAPLGRHDERPQQRSLDGPGCRRGGAPPGRIGSETPRLAASAGRLAAGGQHHALGVRAAGRRGRGGSPRPSRAMDAPRSRARCGRRGPGPPRRTPRPRPGGDRGSRRPSQVGARRSARRVTRPGTSSAASLRRQRCASARRRRAARATCSRSSVEALARVGEEDVAAGVEARRRRGVPRRPCEVAVDAERLAARARRSRRCSTAGARRPAARPRRRRRRRRGRARAAASRLGQVQRDREARDTRSDDDDGRRLAHGLASCSTGRMGWVSCCSILEPASLLWRSIVSSDPEAT